MERAILSWLLDQMYEGGDIYGFKKFWQGSLIWLLLGLFVLINLLIMTGTLSRGFKRLVADRDHE